MGNRKGICFVIMGFGKKQDPYTNITIDLDATEHEHLGDETSKKEAQR